MKLIPMACAPLALLLVSVGGCSKKDPAAEVGANAEMAVNAEAATSAQAAAGAQAAASAQAAAGADATAGVDATLGPDIVVDEYDDGWVAWNIDGDGNVKAAIAGTDGKPIRENLNGSLVYNVEEETKTIPLVLDAKTGFLVGAGPKPEADLSEVKYTVTVNSKPWSGALHVPAGGTASLVAGAKAAAEVNVPEGKVGPNGGVIQVVGKDRIELVSDESSGEVRAYVLDADYNVVPVGEREITVGVIAEAPRTYVFARADAGAYFVAHWHLAADPLKVTIALHDADRTSFALVGYRPGVRVLVGARAPRLHVRTHTKWVVRDDWNDDDYDVNVRAKLKVHHDNGLHRGWDKHDIDDRHEGHGRGGAKVDVHVGGPRVDVRPPHVDIRAGAGVKVGGGAGVKAGGGAGVKAGGGSKGRGKH